MSNCLPSPRPRGGFLSLPVMAYKSFLRKTPATYHLSIQRTKNAELPISVGLSRFWVTYNLHT
ncbi:hypothetical protein L249_0656 [Ophiocordyceps polyrhachis-furcata BCC 54312]|uniref:Uncharacterized protein n=1 Tax=Ophiocordyceps polyrhachis-furcata BCC 54312 TaxID=1330021 RepID=A0A367LG59_9HYPO|nr:hypothetical protein L249_0656 [Ophiocordyceps polyrhachis-furcata BCC 54312]